MTQNGQRLYSRSNAAAVKARGPAAAQIQKQAGRKLRSRAGESIAETLVAVLIISLAMAMLAGMITTTSSLVVNSSNRMENYYTASAKLETLDQGDEITIKITIENKEDGNTVQSVTAISAANRSLGQPVIAYKMTS